MSRRTDSGTPFACTCGCASALLNRRYTAMAMRAAASQIWQVSNGKRRAPTSSSPPATTESSGATSPTPWKLRVSYARSGFSLRFWTKTVKGGLKTGEEMDRELGANLLVLLGVHMQDWEVLKLIHQAGRS